MKTILFAFLLFMNLQVLANSGSPMGLFQVDSSSSIVTLADRDQIVSGTIDVKKSFPDSRIRLESGDTSFESTEITGSLESFEIKGFLSHLGETKEVSLEGKYFGTIDKENGFRQNGLENHIDVIRLCDESLCPSADVDCNLPS